MAYAAAARERRAGSRDEHRLAAATYCLQVPVEPGAAPSKRATPSSTMSVGQAPSGKPPVCALRILCAILPRSSMQVPPRCFERGGRQPSGGSLVARCGCPCARRTNQPPGLLAQSYTRCRGCRGSRPRRPYCARHKRELDRCPLGLLSPHKLWGGAALAATTSSPAGTDVLAAGATPAACHAPRLGDA